MQGAGPISGSPLSRMWLRAVHANIPRKGSQKLVGDTMQDEELVPLARRALSAVDRTVLLDAVNGAVEIDPAPSRASTLEPASHWQDQFLRVLGNALSAQDMSSAHRQFRLRIASARRLKLLGLVGFEALDGGHYERSGAYRLRLTDQGTALVGLARHELNALAVSSANWSVHHQGAPDGRRTGNP